VGDESLIAADCDKGFDVRGENGVGIALSPLPDGMAMTVFRPMGAMSERRFDKCIVGWEGYLLE
jgi:hypothetical protein